MKLAQLITSVALVAHSTGAVAVAVPDTRADVAPHHWPAREEPASHVEEDLWKRKGGGGGGGRGGGGGGSSSGGGGSSSGGSSG